MGSCATSLVKFIIFFFNFVFVVGGIILMAVGGYILSGYDDYKAVLPDLGPYGYPPILMIVIGAVVFLIAFMGCCGTLRESKCMMLTYATLLLVLLVAQIALFTVLVVNKDNTVEFFKEQMTDTMKKYQSVSEVQEGWDYMQNKFHCCGVNGPSDWSAQFKTIPNSCCADSEKCTGSPLLQTAINLVAESQYYYQDGCARSLVDLVMSDLGMYGALALAVVELLGILFGCCLGARFGRKMYHT